MGICNDLPVGLQMMDEKLLNHFRIFIQQFHIKAFRYIVLIVLLYMSIYSQWLPFPL